MSRGTRARATLLALSGLLGASAFGAATAVHVDLEHGSRHGAAGHDHLPDVSAAAEHAHPHHTGSEIPGHSDPGSEDVHQTQSTEHEHALALTADLDRRTGRSSLDRLSNELADPTRSFVCAALSSPRRQPARASPAARSAPLSRRSIVLQV